jgi:hypothetical protein
MLEHLDAGLFVPVELVLKESQKGGTEFIYDLASNLITGVNQSAELGAPPQELDRKLANLTGYITASDFCSFHGSIAKLNWPFRLCQIKFGNAWGVSTDHGPIVLSVSVRITS